MGTAIDIDLGTTNCVVAVLEGSTPRVMTNQEGCARRRLVAVTGSGEIQGVRLSVLPSIDDLAVDDRH
jgi:molecular chaperone DnaK (HSP70)